MFRPNRPIFKNNLVSKEYICDKMFFKNELLFGTKIDFVNAHFGPFKTNAFTFIEKVSLRWPSWAETCGGNITK
jgi:hypothetical protein